MPGQPVTAPAALGSAGCYGKLPARGDFLLRGLPRGFADPWHDWLLDGMQASRAALAGGWLGHYLNAPVWRFTLDAGLCGPQAVAGVLMPSVDKAGRHFPLTLAAAFVPGVTVGAAHGDGGWFDAAEDLALSALTHTLDVETFIGAVGALSTPCGATLYDGTTAWSGGGRWWTLGGEGLAEQGFETAGLPDAAFFTTFLAAAPPGAGADAAVAGGIG